MKENHGQSAPRSELVVLEKPVDSLYVRIKYIFLPRLSEDAICMVESKGGRVESLHVHKHYTWSLHVL